MSRDWRQLSAVAQTANAGGLSDFTLSAAAITGGFLTIPGDEDGNVLWYVAVSSDNSEREVGSGVYTHGSLSIARTTIYQSTNGDDKVDFTEAPIVFLTWGGELFRRLDLVLNVSDGGDVASAREALGLEDADINALVDARIAALQATGDLPPDPSTLEEGDMIAVNALGKYAVVGT